MRIREEKNMLTSLGLIFLSGLLLSRLCRRIGLPHIVGLLLAGILLGPCCLGLLDGQILAVSSELRRMALVIILIKAGLSLDIGDFKRIGRPALMMSFVPASFEILGFVLLGPYILGLSRAECAVLGSVLAAVSPAVVVPRMVQLMEDGYGVKKGVPQMILAGASMDDVFVIVLFSTFTDIARGSGAGLSSLLDAPISIIMGLAAGAAAGYLMAALFGFMRGRDNFGPEIKTVALLGVSFLLLALENTLDGILPLSGLLAVMAMALALGNKGDAEECGQLRNCLGKIWPCAEMVLFALVGAAVDLNYMTTAGPKVLFMIALALVFRACGVVICMLGTPLDRKERLFAVIAYLPKATVQAAIGSVPLSLGMSCGPMVLSAAVLAILTTAPLGAFGMERTYRRLLTCDKE